MEMIHLTEKSYQQEKKEMKKSKDEHQLDTKLLTFSETSLQHLKEQETKH